MLIIFNKLGKILLMRGNKLMYNLALFALLGLVTQSCKKPWSNFDNDQVIITPYPLFVCDTMGALWNTNNGEDFKYLFFSSDGSPTRAVAVSDTNLFMIKNNIYVSEDMGKNFNPAFPTSGPLAIYQSFNFGHQSSILHVPSFKRLYLASANSTCATGLYNDSNGRPGYWVITADANLVNAGAHINSYTQLQNGKVVGFSSITRQAFTKSTPDPLDSWQVKGVITAGAGDYFISHVGNTLVAADATGANGVFISTDEGGSWTPATGIPVGIKILSMGNAFDQASLVGTENGLYRLVAGSTLFAEANAGLQSNVKVTGIVSKDDNYKNGKIKQYVYLSTSKGLYQSNDLGVNWIEMKSESLQSRNFTGIN
jgi:hypothetical protein